MTGKHLRLFARWPLKLKQLSWTLWDVDQEWMRRRCLMEVPVLATVAAVRHHQPHNGQGCNEIILVENQNQLHELGFLKLFWLLFYLLIC
jgi:hypothetical protein